jgi:hypothetical protein
MRTSPRPWRLALVAAALLAFPAVAAEPVRWERLAPLPDSEGFAYPFAGVHRGALLVAGGANFPGKRPWDGGEKVWYDTVFVLERPEGAWKIGRPPPRLRRGEGQAELVHAVELRREREGRQDTRRVRVGELLAVAFKRRALELTLIDHVLEVEVVERVDPPRIDHLIAQRVLVIRMCLLQTSVYVLGIHLH